MTFSIKGLKFYNKELKIGYEYPVDNQYSQVNDDSRAFTYRIQSEMQKKIQKIPTDNKPICNDEAQRFEFTEPVFLILYRQNEEGIRKQTQEFIDVLFENGILKSNIEANEMDADVEDKTDTYVDGEKLREKI